MTKKKEKSDWVMKMQFDTNKGIIDDVHYSKKLDNETELQVPFNKYTIKMKNGQSFELIDDPNVKSLSPPTQIISEIMSKQREDYSDKRFLQIKEKLNNRGYMFEDQTQMVHFIANHGRIEISADKLVVFYIGDQFICEWWDTLDIQTDFDPEKPYSIKSTITYGKPPHS